MVCEKPKSVYHEMWDDNSQEFKAVVRRMKKLGYRVIVVDIAREYQQNQHIGNDQHFLNQ